MSDSNQQNPYDAPLDDKLKEHCYDGIHEYDKRLPNWWLFTFYIAIVISVIYWFSYYDVNVVKTDADRVAANMNIIEARKLSGAIADLDDDKLWEMSRNPQFVTAGEATFKGTCAQCHGPNLEGGIGLPLNDAEWKYGGRPMEVLNIVTNGSPDVTKGMVAWEPTLGPKKVAEVVSFIMSKHERADDGSAL